MVASAQLLKEVSKCLNDICVMPSMKDYREILQKITIHSVKEVEVPNPRKKALVVFIPYRVYMEYVRRIQTRVQQEMEKKLKGEVFLVAHRVILSENAVKMQIGLKKKKIKQSGLAASYKMRPRSRTLTSVHDAVLDDLIYPSEYVSKRVRFVRQLNSSGNQHSVQSRKIYKVYLESNSIAGGVLNESKLDTLSAVYKSLTNRETVFLYPTYCSYY